MIHLNVELGERSYPITIAPGALRDENLAEHIRDRRVLIVTNEVVAPLYLDQVMNNLTQASIQASSLELPDGEQYKTLGTLSQIFDRLIDERHSRSTTLVALGGGVIGDMTGFAAACYQRGVDFVQVPTTLLAQVDSSVGGKTAVNHPRGKNMIGAFYQPRAVVIDTETLTTLPDREYAAGLAEVIKYGLISDAGLFEWLETNMAELIARDPDCLSHAIAMSCRIKARIVAEDETEQGVRAILNLGHTFGHAIEAAQDYRDWLHGEAVAAGMVMAADLSHRMGCITESELDRARTLISEAGLPTSAPPGIGVSQFLDLMGLDKKVQAGKIRLVLIKAIGAAWVTSDFDMDMLRAVLSES